MKKIITNISVSVIGGLVFLLPFLIGLFFLVQAIQTLDKFIKPITVTLGLSHILGGAAILTIALLLLLFIFFIMGLTLRSGKLKANFPLLEQFANKLIPGLELMKAKAGEGNKNMPDPWQAIYLKTETGWRIAVITEKTEGKFSAVYVPLSNDLENGEIRLIELAATEFIKITLEEADHFLKEHGRGAATLLNKLQAE